MKVNITINNLNSLNGYLNLDPVVKEAGSPKVKADISNLDDHLDIAECTELRSSDVLNYFESEKVDNILNNWISKIRKGGIISISEIDLDKVYKAFARNEINLTTFNTLVFGEQSRNWDFKKSILNMDVVCEALKAKGLEIIEKSFLNYNFIITARRN